MFSFSRAKLIYIALGLVLLISVAAIFFIFRNHATIAGVNFQKNNNRLFIAPTALPNAAIFPPRTTPSSSSAVSAKASFGTTTAPEDTTSSFLDKIKRAAQEVQQMNAATLNTSDFDIKKSTVTPDGIVLNIEPAEFAYIYPQNFLDSLQNVAQPFIQSEDASFTALSVIKTDADVRTIEEKLINALYQAGIYKNEQVASAQKTIRFTLPRLQLIDLQARAQGLLFQEQFRNKDSFQRLALFIKSAPEFLNFVYADNLPKQAELAAQHSFFFSDLINQLKSAIAPSAQAICGYCYDLPECYGMGLSPPGIPGKETFRAACTCTGCLSGLGCSDGCGSGVAYIFDPLTFICGCGI